LNSYNCQFYFQFSAIWLTLKIAVFSLYDPSYAPEMSSDVEFAVEHDAAAVAHDVTTDDIVVVANVVDVVVVVHDAAVPAHDVSALFAGY
jgi:hypothetical protein